jgi:hypothetical protein
MFGVTGLHCHQLKTKKENDFYGWSYFFSYGFWALNWILGHIAGGTVLFGLIGWFGSNISNSVRFYCVLVLGLFCFIGALQQFKITRFPLPQLKRQVSRLWLNNLHKNIIALGYGFQLGSGVATRIKVATIYVVIGFAFCSGSFLTGAIIGMVFGLSRSILPIVLAPQTSSPDKSLIFALKFNSYNEKVQKINGIALLVSGIALNVLNLMPGIEELIK